MIDNVTWNTTVTMSLPMWRLRGSCCLQQSGDYPQLGGKLCMFQRAGHVATTRASNEGSRSSAFTFKTGA